MSGDLTPVAQNKAGLVSQALEDKDVLPVPSA